MYCSNVMPIVCVRHGISNRGKMNVRPVGVLVCVYIWYVWYQILYFLCDSCVCVCNAKLLACCLMTMLYVCDAPCAHACPDM